MNHRREYITQKPQRDMMLFIKYLNVIKGYGDHAMYIPVSKKIEEAAMPFCISKDRASRIIWRMLKERGKTCKITILECNELLDELESISEHSVEKFEKRVTGLNNILIQVGISKTHEEVKGLVQTFLMKG